MVKLSDLFRESSIDIPEVGRVKLREASIGSLGTAFDLAENEPNESKSAVFSNHLLSLMLVEPTWSEKRISQLSEEQFCLLAIEAAKLQDAAEFSNWSDSSVDARTHLYNALEAQQRRFFESVTKPAMEALANSPMLLGLNTDFIPSALSPFDDTVGKLVGLQLPAIQTDLMSALSLIDAQSVKLPSLETIPESVLGISQSFLDATSFNLGSELISAYSALSIVPDNIAQLAKSSLTSVASALTSEMSILPSITETIASRFDFSNALIARGLIYSGIDSPSIHSDTYIEPDYIIVESESDAREAEQQEEKQRRLRCQDAFFELELKLREIIRTELKRFNGDRWWKQRVPEGIRSSCSERKTKREIGAAPKYEPIHYANFGELKDIIAQGSNWKEAFKPIFHNETIFAAMYQLVTTVRNDLDHSRISTNHDYLRFMLAVNWFYEMLGLLEPFEVSEVTE